MIYAGDMDVARLAGIQGCILCQTKGFCYFCPVKSKEYMFLHLRYPSKKEKFFCMYKKIVLNCFSTILFFIKSTLADSEYILKSSPLKKEGFKANYISTISTPSIRATVIKSLSPRPETVAIII